MTADAEGNEIEATRISVRVPSYKDEGDEEHDKKLANHAADLISVATDKARTQGITATEYNELVAKVTETVSKMTFPALGEMVTGEPMEMLKDYLKS